MTSFAERRKEENGFSLIILNKCMPPLMLLPDFLEWGQNYATGLLVNQKVKM